MAQVDDLLTALVAQVDSTDTVVDGAVTFVNGVPALIAAAVAAATASGPALTPAQVQIFTDVGTKLKARADAIAAAVANVNPTPAPAGARRGPA